MLSIVHFYITTNRHTCFREKKLYLRLKTRVFIDTHLVHPAHLTLESHLDHGHHLCWLPHFRRSDQVKGGRCAEAAGSTAGLGIQPGSRWDGQPVPWSYASKGLPSQHLEQAPTKAESEGCNRQNTHNHQQEERMSAFTFSNGLCEAGEELMFLGQSEWSAFWLLVEILW